MNKTSLPNIIILGIDGLEYDLVEKWLLKNLMQKKYCKLDLSDYKVIVTPPIWGSMLTGKIDEEIMKKWVRLEELIGCEAYIEKSKLSKFFEKILPEKINFWLADHILVPLIGGDPFKTTANYVKDKKMPTFFDFFEKPWTNGLPSYGRNVSTPIQKKLTENAIMGEKTPYRKFIIENYKKDKEQLLEKIKNKENDLIFWYTSLLDNFGHMDIGKPVTHMMKHYLEINSLVGIVKEKCPNSIIYIISDHGMRPLTNKKNSWGVHSDHAFFSSNTGEEIRKPAQLYELLLKHRRNA